MSRIPEKYLQRLQRLPTPEQEERSKLMKCDSFYTLPREVECFIDRANQELPKGWVVKPWTINRAVTLFHKGESVKVIDYDYILNGYMVKALDLVNSISRSASRSI